MAKVKTTNTAKRIRPALTPKARENQMISLAMDCAERQLQEGTASSQVITHFLKLGSSRYEKEIERLEEENKLLRAKTKAIESAEVRDALYLEAIEAMRRYSGNGDSDER